MNISNIRRLLLCATLWAVTPVAADAPAITPRGPVGGATAGGAAAITRVAPAVAPARGLRILSVGEDEVATLRDLNGASDVQAVTLGAGLNALRSDAAAQQALLDWVRGGGTVLLHNDAAQLFGYQTVPLRETTPLVAGQRFGRARAALPFGASPLLWRMPPANAPAAGTATGAAPARRPPAASAFGPPSGAASVRVVYYQMSDGDHLVTAHPAGVPLLRVTDLPLSFAAGLNAARMPVSPADARRAARTAPAVARVPLYAAAIAPFGRGWAVFTPSLVEQHRGDGAAFVQNLLRLAGAAHQTAANRARGANSGAANNRAFNTAFPAGALVSLPAALIEGAANAAAQPGFNLASLANDFAAAANGLALRDLALRDNTQNTNADTARAPGLPPLELEIAPAGLMLSPSEVMATALLLNAARTGAPDNAVTGARADTPPNAAQARAITMLCLLRMRLELQRGNLAGAATWLDNAETAVASAAETLLWRGVLAMARSADADMNTLAGAPPLPGTAAAEMPAPVRRAALLDEAAASWSRALAAGSLLAGVGGQATLAGPNEDGANLNQADTGAANGAAVSIVPDTPPTVAGMPRALLASWVADARIAARLAMLEPPVSLAANRSRDGAASLIVRHDGSGQTLQALPALLSRLAAASSRLGWSADGQELLIFPSVAAYFDYREAAVAAMIGPAAGARGDGAETSEDADAGDADGAPRFNFPPWTRFADVLGSRLLMVTPARQELGGSGSGGAARGRRNRNRSGQAGQSAPGVVVPALGRLQARALVFELAQGGAPLPQWMLIGLAALGDQRVAPAVQVTTRPGRRSDRPGIQINGATKPQAQAALNAAAERSDLRKLARAGRLLQPQEFDEMPSDIPVAALADAQALGLMRFFYRQFGAGRVVETLQRLGAGQPADEALFATTGLTQTQFFAAWRRADLNVR